MSVLTDALQPHFAATLLSLRARPSLGGLQQAVTQGAYTPIVALTPTRIGLDFRDPAIAASVFAADAYRLAGAAFETMLTIERGEAHVDVAWRLIQTYYAAFYASHALLRFFGRGVTHFTGRSTTYLSTLLTTIGSAAPFALRAGQYDCTLVGSQVQLRSPGGSNSAPHQLFWRVFATEMDRISNAVLVGPLPRLVAQSAAVRLDEVRRVLQHQAHQDGFLCAMRNELQYRHGLGVWFPSRLQRRACSSMRLAISRWSEDPMVTTLSTSSDQVLDFVSACVFLVATCRAVVVRISQRAPGSRSFLDSGPVRLLRESGRGPQ